jgi:hypothetical protein
MAHGRGENSVENAAWNGIIAPCLSMLHLAPKRCSRSSHTRIMLGEPKIESSGDRFGCGPICDPLSREDI